VSGIGFDDRREAEGAERMRTSYSLRHALLRKTLGAERSAHSVK
jgi:hypothetical protein